MKSFSKLKFVLLLCCCMVLSGCYTNRNDNTVEDIAPVTFWYIQEGKKGKMRISTIAPPLSKESKRIITRDVSLIEDGGNNFDLSYHRQVMLGQMRMVFINEAIARKGIISIINTFFADPDISQRLYLIVVKGDLEKYLEQQIKEEKKIDYYFYRMFKHLEEDNPGNMTVVNLHSFVKKLYDSYAHPTLPVFKVQGQEFLYEGTGVFNQSKLISVYSNLENSMLRLMNRKDLSLQALPIPALQVSIGQINSNVKEKFSKDFSTLHITVNMDATIEEYVGKKDLATPTDFKRLNEEIEDYLEKKSATILEKLKKNGLDPLGFGDLTLTPFNKPLSSKEWLDTWKHCKIDVKYEVKFKPLTNNFSNKLINAK